VWSQLQDYGWQDSSQIAHLSLGKHCDRALGNWVVHLREVSQMARTQRLYSARQRNHTQFFTVWQATSGWQATSCRGEGFCCDCTANDTPALTIQ
jgi:hypothetical protein